jgi:3-dehydroquinate synthase
MPVIERTVQVQWRHQVHFTEEVFAPGNSVLRSVIADPRPAPFGRPAKVLIILDEALAVALPGLRAQIEAYFAHHSDALQLVAPPVPIVGGEAVKNAYFRVSEIHALIDRHHIDRHNYVVAVGGGALLDMVGLAAATAHRGVRHVRIPTTTLAQDDSGVGVKNGINAFGKKNFIGTFAPPFAVINDFTLLATLSTRDKRAGYVEAVKVACIRDAAFFHRLELSADALATFEPTAMKALIRRSAELHLDHIASSGDPFEMGSARPLDFGHWAAHKLEQLSEYRLRHGEAVAVGVAMDVIYARLRGYLPAAEAERILALLERLGFELFTQELAHTDEDGQLLVVAGLEEFREHLGGELTITLLRAIGDGFEVHEMDQTLVARAISELRERHFLRQRTVPLAGAQQA